MRCFVSGVAGFIGSHLAERLLADGHEVLGVDAFISYYHRSIKERNLERARSWQGFTFVEGNLLALDLPPLLEGVQWVFHLAAQAGVRASWGQDFVNYVSHNIMATQRLLDAVLQVGGVQRFIYSSSSSIYGNASALPVEESLTPHPISPYGVTKLTGEHLCDLYYHTFGLPTVSLRYFTVYGARQRPDMAFHRFCQAILDRQAISIHGDGSQTRDFTAVQDVVAANVLAASTEAAGGRVFNIAGGSRVSLQEVLRLLAEITAQPVRVEYGPKQPGDVIHTYADIRQAETILGYHPQISLARGLADEFAFVQASQLARQPGEA